MTTHARVRPPPPEPPKTPGTRTPPHTPGEKFGERLYAACHDPSRPPPHISSPPDYSAVHRAPQITKVLSAMALWKAAGP